MAGADNAPGGRWAFAALLALLVWAPVPLASNRSWALALLAMLCSALLLAVLVGRAWRPVAVPSAKHWAVPLGLLLGYGVLVLLQLVPLPQAVLRLVAPGAADAAGAVSGDPFATRKHLLAWVAFASVFALVLLLVNSRQRLRWLMGTVLVSGAAQAMLAVFLLSLRTEYEFLFTVFPVDGRAVGTFSNTNHLAGYLQLALAMGVGLMLTGASTGSKGGRGWRGNTVAALQFLMSTKMLVRLLLVMMVIALVLTRSRGGNAAFFAALLVTGAWVAWRSRELRTTALVVVASMVVVDVLVVGQWVGLDKVVQRMEATQLQAQVEEDPQAAAQPGAAPSLAARRSVHREETLGERLTAAGYALAMVQERPWLGHGGGTFHSAFPRFKGPVPLGQYDHAHNDYVEIAADTGVPGALLLFGLALAALWRAGRAVSDKSDAHARGAAVAVVMATASMAVHSMVDFNMHVPANALTFCAVLALAWCTVADPRQRNGTGSSGSGSGRMQRGSSAAGAAGSAAAAALRWQAVPAVLLAAVVASWAWWFGNAVLRADLVSAAARQQAADWALDGKGWTADTWPAARQALLQSAAITPSDPLPHETLAQLYMTQGVVAWRDPVQREAFLGEAEDHLLQVLRLRPADGRAWANLAQVRYGQGKPMAEMQQAWLKARQLAPREAPVQQALALLVLDTYDTATPDMRAWLKQAWQQSAPAVQAWLTREAELAGRPQAFR